MVRVRAVTPLDGYRLRLRLTDGSVIEREIGDLLWGPVFERVRSDRGVFSQVRVGGGTIAWPGNLDIDPDVLIWGGPAPHEPRDPPPTLKVRVPA